MQTVVVVDDHPIVRQGLIRLIAEEPDLRVVGEAEDGETAMRIVRAAMPQLVLVDLSLKNSSGIELIKEITSQLPSVRVLVVSLHDESIYAERALRAGARGFIMKTEATDNVLVAIKEVLAGRIYVSPGLNSELLSLHLSHDRSSKAGMGIEALTDRELEVLRLLGEGKGTALIARALNLSVKTVETYKAHLKRKLNVKDSAALMQFAIRICSEREL